MDIYPSNKIDWQPIESISGIFYAFHAYVGKQLYKEKNQRDLAHHARWVLDCRFWTLKSSNTVMYLSRVMNMLMRIMGQDFEV